MSKTDDFVRRALINSIEGMLPGFSKRAQTALKKCLPPGKTLEQLDFAKLCSLHELCLRTEIPEPKPSGTV